MKFFSDFIATIFNSLLMEIELKTTHTENQACVLCIEIFFSFEINVFQYSVT